MEGMMEGEVAIRKTTVRMTVSEYWEGKLIRVFWKCKECDNVMGSTGGVASFNFCPWCGRKIDGEEEVNA